MKRNFSNSSNAGENINVQRSSWSFEGISNEFENHIKKSVPLYKNAQELVTSLSDFFVKPNSIVIDI